MESNSDSRREAFVSRRMHSRRIMTWGTVASLLSFPLLLLISIAGPPWAVLLLLPMIFTVGGWTWIEERRTRRHQYGFWLLVERLSPTKMVLTLLAGAAVALFLLVAELIVVSGGRIFRAWPVFLVQPGVLPLMFLMVLVASRIRRRWYGDVLLRHVMGSRAVVVQAVRQGLDGAGVEYAFDEKGKVRPYVGPTFALREGPRLIVVPWGRRGESVALLKVGVPGEEFRPGPGMRVVDQALETFDPAEMGTRERP